MAQHQVLVFNPNRGYVGDLTSAVTEFRYVKAANAIGYFEITAPTGEWPIAWRYIDYQYHFWRKPNGGEWKLDFVGLARDRFSHAYSGVMTNHAEGFGLNDILARRIIAAKAGSAGATKTDFLDDMMKTLVSENLGGGAAAGRNIAEIFGLAIAPDLSDAPSVTKSFAYENLLETLQSLADTSAGQASGAVDLFFDIVCTGYNSANMPTFEFRTSTGQPGIDRTDNGANGAAVVFSLENGNIDDVDYQRVFSEEHNYIYAGGQGLEADRALAEVGDNARIGQSPINRRELFVSATHLEDAEISEAAYEALNENRPTSKLSCTLLDTETTPYGVAWNWGDKVTVYYGKAGGDTSTAHFGYEKLDEVVRVVEVRVDSNKKETIRAQFGFGATMGNAISPLMKQFRRLERDFKRAIGGGAEFAKYVGDGATVPTTTELPREGMYYLYDNGISRRAYYNLGGVIRYATLT